MLSRFAAIALAMACGISHAAVITYTIAVDDGTNGVGGNGHWGIYASTSGSRGGLAAYNYTISSNAAIAQTDNIAPEAFYTDSGGANSALGAGFTLLRTNNTAKAATGSLDIFHTPFDGIYNFGVSAGSIPNLPPTALQTAFADPNSTNGLGWDGETGVTQAGYGGTVPSGVPAGAVLLAKGSYSGAVGSLGSDVATWFDNSNLNKNNGNVFDGTSGFGNSQATSVVLHVVEEAPIPEPATLCALAIGLGACLLRRRRA